MRTFYLWCQAWPGYVQDFEFGRFEHLEGRSLLRELQVLAEKWDRKHPGKVSEEMEKRARRLRAEVGGKPRGWYERDPEPRSPTLPEVAVAAGWVSGPAQTAFDANTGELTFPGGAEPTERVYFHASDNVRVAELILGALRERKPEIGRPFRFHRTVLRYGRLDAAKLDASARLLIERSLEVTLDGTDKTRAWAASLVEEASRLAAIAARADARLNGPTILTKKETAVLGFLCKLSAGEALNGGEILQRLDSAGLHGTTQSDLTTRIIPRLRIHFAVPNRKNVGYYLDPKDRAKAAELLKSSPPPRRQ